MNVTEIFGAHTVMTLSVAKCCFELRFDVSDVFILSFSDNKLRRRSHYDNHHHVSPI